MEPAVLGGKLASSLVAPLVKKLFVTGGPGAGLVDRPVRLDRLVSFRGERRTLGEREVRLLAGKLVGAALDSPGEQPFPRDETGAVSDALTARLLALGDLDMDDVQAVRLGHGELAARLRRQAAGSGDGLSTDARYFLDSATEWACLHVLEFFTRRSTFVARTLVSQTRGQAELIAKVDELITRIPRPDARDTAFERRYLPYVAEQHNRLTIYGLDLRESPDRWPLEVAYLNLEATLDGEPDRDPVPGESAPVRTGRTPADEVLDKEPRVLLRGEAGSGKTTLVQWLAVTTARAGTLIPYILPLRTLIRTGPLPTPAAFLSAVGCPLSPPDGWTERVLSAGRALVLVDGLDEVPAADRHTTRDWLRGLVHAYPGNRWLLTTRPTAVRADWLAQEKFRELSLAPMGRAEVATFVHRWHEAARAPEYEQRLLDSLRTKRDLSRLVTNPLMCGLICALHRERRGYLPTGRKELYNAALTMLLARRDRERGMGAVDGAELGEEAQLELLQRIAYALVLSGRNEMSLETAEGIVERALPTLAPLGQEGASAALRTLLLRSGVVRRPAEGILDFVHRTFQDYLAARYAVEEGHLPVLTSRAGDSQWEDVIRMAVAHARPRERVSVLRELLARHTPRLTLLALACLEHATALDPAVRAEVEERAAALIPPRTAEAARDLATAGPLVLELLPGPDELTQAEALGVTVAASVLGGEEPDGALAVLRRFREHPDLHVRRQLVGTWHRFDAHEYAGEVLDHIDRTDLLLDCTSPAQLGTLAGMRPWPRLRVSGPHRAEEIVAAVPEPTAVTELSVGENPLLNDLTVLRALPALTRLTYYDCPNALGLDRLAGLSLAELIISSDHAALSGLRALTSLTLLSLVPKLPGTTLTRSLPLEAPLGFLYLGDRCTESTGLRGLAHWKTLHTLSLGALTTELTEEDWREVAALPGLTRLYLNAAIIRDLPASIGRMPELPTVEELFIPSLEGTEHLAALAPRLPNLMRVALLKRRGHDFPMADFAALFPGVELADFND
ncbi:NACHT domain-containing protein [Streptomyces coelicoflavus]